MLPRRRAFFPSFPDPFAYWIPQIPLPPSPSSPPSPLFPIFLFSSRTHTHVRHDAQDSPGLTLLKRVARCALLALRDAGVLPEEVRERMDRI